MRDKQKAAAYQRKWRKANPGKHAGYIKRSRGARVARVRAFLWQYRMVNSCVDCGESDPRCLDFDHRDPKTKRFEVTRKPNISIDTIKIEIAKCDVRCANCHRKRTYEAKAWMKPV